MELLQNTLVIMAGIISLAFLLRKFVFKKTTDSDDNCGPDCGCS